MLSSISSMDLPLAFSGRPHAGSIAKANSYSLDGIGRVRIGDREILSIDVPSLPCTGCFIIVYYVTGGGFLNCTLAPLTTPIPSINMAL